MGGSSGNCYNFQYVSNTLNLTSNKNKVNSLNNINKDNNISTIKKDNNNNNNVLKMIWIDANIKNFENKIYTRELEEIVSLTLCSTIIEGLNEIKKIKFQKVIIMLSKRMFNDFIQLFEQEKTKICCSLNIIVFTQNENKILIKEICDNNKTISSGYLFNKENIFDKFGEIRNYISKEKEPKVILSPHFDIINNNNKKYYEEEIGNFEKIENYEELILPIYFHKIIEPITLEEIHNFNYYLSSSFVGAKKILSQFDNLPEMPIEVICKYWAYIYTLEKGKFYSVLNTGLRNKNYKIFLPFIKMMYEGIKRKVFTSITNKPLFSGGIISNKELQELIKNQNNNIINNNLPKLIYYFKSFKSFTTNEKVAKSFMNKQNEDSIKVLFIVKPNHIEGEFYTNASLKEFSKFSFEDEVVFFPFSCFEVENIEKDRNNKNQVYIFLNYLGRYKSKIEEKKPKNFIFKDIPINQYGKDIFEFGLIKYKFSKFWEVNKEIPLEENANCLLVFEKKIILISIGSSLRIYNNINNLNNCINIYIHQDIINDLLKLNENTFISSSNDKTIKFIQLTDNYSKLIVIKALNIHNKGVNQTIKLKEENLYASCSNDKTIKLWKYDFKDNKSNVIERTSINSESKIFCICELANSNFASMTNNCLIFWKKNDFTYEEEKILKGFKKCLHKCLVVLNDQYILVGTKKIIYFIDINTKEKIRKFLLDYNAYSICYFNKTIFLGLKNRNNSCLLYEYKYENEKNEINFECIGKGCDLCSRISFIYALDEKTIITCNENNFVKIWKETEKKPKKLFYENNKDFYIQKDYDSDDSDIDLKIKKNHRNKNNVSHFKEETSKGDDEIIQNDIPKGDNDNIKNETPKLDDEIKEKKTPGELIITSYNKNFISNKNIENKNIYVNEKNDYDKSLISKEDDPKLNIKFSLSTGLNLTINCEKDITLEKLIQLFFEKFNYDFNNYDENIVFAYNGQKLDVHSQEKIKNIFHDNSIIVVFDVQNLLAKIDNFKLMTPEGKDYNLRIPSKGNLYSLLKIYFEKIGKPVEENDLKILKDITFEDFVKKLSGSNK